MASFKDFLNKPIIIEDHEVVNLYLHDKKAISEISFVSGKSVGEIYRILKNHHVYPNRLKTRHNLVHYYNQSGLPLPEIANITGYTIRNIRNIIK